MRTLTLLMICISFFATSQAQVKPASPAGNCINSVQHLKDGQVGITRAVSFGEQGNRKALRPDIIPVNSNQPAPLKPGKSMLTTHHITFHFDKSWSWVSLNGNDTAFWTMSNLYWTDNYTVYGDIPDGYFYLYTELQQVNTIFYILQNAFHVYRDMDTTVLSSSANHNLSLMLFDKNGNVLVNNNGNESDQFGFNVIYPPQYKQRYGSVVYAGLGAEVLKISDVGPDIRLAFGKTNVPLNTPYHFYVSNYPVLDGINKDTILARDPGEYRYLPLRYHNSPDFHQAYYGWEYGTFTNDSLLSMHLDPFIGVYESNQYPGSGEDTVYCCIAGDASYSSPIIFAFGVNHMENDPQLQQFTEIIWPPIFLDPHDQFILSCNGNFPAVKGDYKIIPGSGVNIGFSAPFHHAMGLNETGNGDISISQYPMDQTSARRYTDFNSATYDIWRGNVHLQHQGLGEFMINYSGQPDLYSVIVNDSNYNLLGKQGYLKSDLTFDLRRSDPNPPRIMAFRVMMGDSIKSQLIHGYPASVEFTAGDYTLVPGVAWIYHNLASVLLKFKDYNDTAWYDLPVITETTLLNPFCGMPYYADLQLVLDHFADSAWVDLQVKITDSAGNYNTQTMHPAFLVRDALVGIPGPAKDAFFSLYPNPVNDILRISTEESSFTATVYNMSGQVLIEQSDCREINVSGLAEGVYIVKLQSGSNGHTFFRNFVKIFYK